MSTSNALHRIVIVGGGAGGLPLAAKLGDTLGRRGRAEITLVDHNDTFMIGLGARLRVRPTVYVVLEAAPRVAGFRPGVNPLGVAIEKHAGGHQFQLNFSNSFGSTMAQIARGGVSNSDWYLGFNISRKFF